MNHHKTTSYRLELEKKHTSLVVPQQPHGKTRTDAVQ